MKLEFLKSAPESGQYEEHCFDDSGATSWVLFETNQFEKWVGAFGLGEEGISKIVCIDEYALVIANGAGYIVNQNSKTAEQLEDSDYGGIKSAIATHNPDLIICSTLIGYKVIKGTKIILDERPGWIDGLEFLKQENKILKGQMFKIGPHNYWNEVSLNLETFELEIDGNVKIDYWGLIGKKKNSNEKHTIIDMIKSLFRANTSA